MPDFLRPTARWWYDLPPIDDEPLGSALSEALLAEEAQHGLTADVAWAYAEAMPAMLGPDPMVDLRPLACRRGAIRAAALNEPVDIDGLYHVQTSSPEVCRVMGARVPSFFVEGDECLEALLSHGSAVRKVVAGCAPIPVVAPFLLSFRPAWGDPAGRWFKSYILDQFMPIARLDLAIWLCWDRDLGRPCVVKENDAVFEGRWGPRDVAPEAEPPPWAEPDADVVHGEGWAVTMLHNHRRGGSSLTADPARGWCRLHAEGEIPYHEALRAAWRADASLRDVTGLGTYYATLASLRFERDAARFAWIGLERVLRLRGSELEQLTTDHDLKYAARQGISGITEEMLAQIKDLPRVITRSVPESAPDEGSCSVEPGDRFLLIPERSQEELERDAGGRDAFVQRLREGTPRQLARWMRDVIMHVDDEQPIAIIDAGASIELRPPKPRVKAPAEPTMRDLVERPAEFHNRRVRLRGIYHHMMEVSDFAGAWFTGERSLRWGIWVVEAEGLWLCDGTERGHMGQYKSELRGSITPVDLSRPRRIKADQIRFARRYVPLSSEIVVERRLLGWTHDGQWVTRIGPDGRLPAADAPERCRAKATFIVGMSGNLGVIDWELLDATPLAPERAKADAPGRRGRYVEISGYLEPTADYPLLDGALRISPPSLTFSDKRHTIPQAEAAARYRSILGAGRWVTVRGEVGHSSLMALSIADASGPLDL